MEVHFNPNPVLPPIPAMKFNPQNLTPKSSLRWPLAWKNRGRFAVKVALDSATLDELGLPESNVRNPSVSTSYRNPRLPRPNQTVLDAQTKVCTGPTQTKPLSGEQAFEVLDTILKSGNFSFGQIVLFLQLFSFLDIS